MSQCSMLRNDIAGTIVYQFINLTPSIQPISNRLKRWDFLLLKLF